MDLPRLHFRNRWSSCARHPGFAPQWRLPTRRPQQLLPPKEETCLRARARHEVIVIVAITEPLLPRCCREKNPAGGTRYQRAAVRISNCQASSRNSPLPLRSSRISNQVWTMGPNVAQPLLALAGKQADGRATPLVEQVPIPDAAAPSTRHQCVPKG
jgi:hypothetical protein